MQWKAMIETIRKKKQNSISSFLQRSLASFIGEIDKKSSRFLA